MLQSFTGADCQKCEPRLSLAILHELKLRSVVAQDVSCRDGDTDPDDKLDGDGGVGDVLLWCCHGMLSGGDNVTGTTFLTIKIHSISHI